jgi:hypothetical protein
MTDRPVAVRKPPTTLGQLLSALDDRNLSRAMRLLDPARESAERESGERESAEHPSDPDQQDAARCVRCATRGE